MIRTVSRGSRFGDPTHAHRVLAPLTRPDQSMLSTPFNQFVMRLLEAILM
jgi:hypothetical protein